VIRKISTPDHATPLSHDERKGLIPARVSTHAELNALEEENILSAMLWAFSRRRDPVSESFGKNLHKRMFGRVWRWAGAYRRSEKNLGVAYGMIPSRMAETMERLAYWCTHKTFETDEIAVRFHHALVSIHPFPNGNGRWSRLMADLLAVRLGRPRFGWGQSALREGDDVRRLYIDALRAADGHDFGPLLHFARR